MPGENPPGSKVPTGNARKPEEAGEKKQGIGSIPMREGLERFPAEDLNKQPVFTDPVTGNELRIKKFVGEPAIDRVPPEYGGGQAEVVVPVELEGPDGYTVKEAIPVRMIRVSGGGEEASPVEATASSALAEETPRERKIELGSKVIEAEDAMEQLRRERREARAQEFAEKHGLTAEREELLTAERAYYEAQRSIQSKNTHFIRKVPREVQEAYDTARNNWDKALQGIVSDETLPKQERQRATVISFRDRIMRQAEVRSAARKEGLDVRGKTALGTALRWGKKTATAAPKAYLTATKHIGSLVAKGHIKISRGDNVEVLAQRYARATRIVGSAALGTAVFGGFGAAGVALPFLLRAARGTLGVAVGTAAGYGAGKLYKKTIGAASIADLRAAKRAESGEDKGAWTQREQEEAFKQGSADTRAKQQRLTELLAAFLAGGATAMGTGALAEKMFDNPAVRDALDTIDKAENGESLEPTSAAGATDTPNVSAEQPSEASPEPAPAEQQAPEAVPAVPVSELQPGEPKFTAVIDQPGEGTDSIFAELQQQIRAQLDAGTLTHEQVEASPVLKHLLESHPNEISRAMGETIYGENGMLTHEGDSFFIDDEGNLWFDPAGDDTEPQPFLSNDLGEPNGIREHVLEAKPLHPLSEASDAASTNASESTPASTPAAAPEPAAELPPQPVETSASQPVATQAEQTGTAAEAAVRDAQEAAGQLPTELPSNEGAPGIATPPVPETLGELPEPLYQQAPAMNRGLPPIPETDSIDSSVPPLPDAETTLGDLPPAPAAEWQPGQPLPERTAVIGLSGSEGQPPQVYAHALSSQESLQAAQEYARTHPGAIAYYDNPKPSLLPFFGTDTPRIGSIVYDQQGNRTMTEEVLDIAGKRLTTLEPIFEKELPITRTA